MQGCSRPFEKWGAHLYWALFPGKIGGTRSTFYLSSAKKLEDLGPPPGPLGNYIPAM